MKIFWTLVLSIVCFQISAGAAVSTKTYSETSLKLGLNYLPTDWTFFDSNDYAAAGSLFLAKPLDKKLSQSSLSLRVDEANFKDAKKYAEKWLRDYPKFGYELLLSQETKYGNLDGFEFELIAKKADKKLRQFVVKNDENKFLIFTCTANKDEFAETLKQCQKLLATAHLIK